MRWVTNKCESDYMRNRQAQNKARCVSSAAEQWMADKLSGAGIKFTRQAMWGYRLFDFWIATLGIAIEVDGPEHDQEYDAFRDRYNYLRSGIVVLRVKNFDEESAATVIQKLRESELWKVRRLRIGAGKQLVKLHGLELAHGGSKRK